MRYLLGIYERFVGKSCWIWKTRLTKMATKTYKCAECNGRHGRVLKKHGICSHCKFEILYGDERYEDEIEELLEGEWP
jgi:DNA-directed RNA polymerase subunit RPC12/RpoP